MTRKIIGFTSNTNKFMPLQIFYEDKVPSKELNDLIDKYAYTKLINDTRFTSDFIEKHRWEVDYYNLSSRQVCKGYETELIGEFNLMLHINIGGLDRVTYNIKLTDEEANDLTSNLL